MKTAYCEEDGKSAVASVLRSQRAQGPSFYTVSEFQIQLPVGQPHRLRKKNLLRPPKTAHLALCLEP